MIAPIPINHDAHQAPKIVAISASPIRKSPTPRLRTHRAAVTPSKPTINIVSPHQNEATAYIGYQTKVKTPSMANPPITIKMALPIKTIIAPKFVSVVSADKVYHLPEPSRDSVILEDLFLFT